MKIALRVLSIFLSIFILLQYYPQTVRAQDDQRYFAATGFRISDDRFWDYFNKRGGLRTFGYPVSRKFLFLGTAVQMFQRRMMQIQPDGSVGLVNMLDTDIFPYTSVNGATLPEKNDQLVAQAPPVGSSNYAQTIIQFVRQYAPDLWNGIPVNFYQTFLSTVSLQDAFPGGGGDPGFIPGLALEIWGVPVSLPLRDPNNHTFVYQRFQRGIMHFDATIGLTQGLLLADYFKAILMGTNLPFDLVGPASQSRYYKQYDNSKTDGLARPSEMPGSNLKDAFEIEGPVGVIPPPPSLPPHVMLYGMQAQMIDQDQNRTLGLLKGTGFGWIKQQVRWSDIEPAKGAIDFGKLDPVVNSASLQGVKLLFSVVSVPTWARTDRRSVGPPNDPNDLGDFLAAVATRYQGKVQAYEVWNEQNLAWEWTTPIDSCAYVDMLLAVTPRIQAADPTALIITGALTPTGVNDPNIAIDDATYLGQLYQCRGGIFKTLGHAVGVHAVGYNNAPGDWVDVHTVNTSGYKDHPSFYFRRMFQLHDIMVANGDLRPVWVTEYEWGSAQPPVPAGYEWTTELDEATVADFFVQGINMMKAQSWVQAFFVWNLNFRTFANYHVSETAIFGMLNEDWSPRLIYTHLRDMSK